MAREVSRAPRLNFIDYWPVFVGVSDPSGSLSVDGIFTFANEHPIFIPAFIYWLNARFMGASNNLLGFTAIATALACLLLLTRYLPQGLSGWTKTAVVLAMSSTLFSIKGIHNFALGMSGVAWWSANLAAVIAVFSAARGRTIRAVASASVGCLCYGTAFALWPAIAVVAFVRGDRRRKLFVPIVTGIVAAGMWLTLRGPQASHGELQADSVTDGSLTLLATLGGLWTSNSNETAIIAALTLMAIACAATIPLWGHVTCPRLFSDKSKMEGHQRDTYLGWSGLIVYTFGAAALIATSRAQNGDVPGLASRYASIAGLFTAAVVVLLVSTNLPRKSALIAACVVVSVAAATLGSGAAADTRARYPGQELLAIAVRLDAVSAAERTTFPDAARERLAALGGFPFSEDFSLDCEGFELGDVMDSRSITPLPHRPLGAEQSAAGLEPYNSSGPIRIVGWSMVDGDPPDCVLAIDVTGAVVGGGIVETHLSTNVNNRSSFVSSAYRIHAAAPAGISGLRVILFANGAPYEATAGDPK